MFYYSKKEKKIMLNLSKSKNGMLKPKDKNTFLLKKKKENTRTQNMWFHNVICFLFSFFVCYL